MEPLDPVQDPMRVGPYVLVWRLGVGGMGRVFLGYSRSGRKVAVKVVHADLAARPDFRARFAREVAAAGRVSGFYTAPVIDSDSNADRPWMATEYIAAPSLRQIVETCGPLPGDAVGWVAAGICEALVAIHKVGIIHRDLSPSNVLVSTSGVRVIDFGIARIATTPKITKTGELIGTPRFMSPEQVAGREPLTPASDVYSLGATLLYAATGCGPGELDDEGQRSLVPELREAVLGCLPRSESERLTPGQVLALLAGRSGAESAPPLPVRVEQMLARVEAAVDRVPIAAAPVDTLPYTERIIGPAPSRRVIGDWDPVSLGVHSAIRVPVFPRDSLPDLPLYVARRHDRDLRALLDDPAARPDGGACWGIVDRQDASSVRGRARLSAAVERRPAARCGSSGRAVRDRGPLHGLWLDEAQVFFLDPDGSAAASALRRRLDRDDHVVAVATMWPEYWDILAASPRSGEPDPHRHTRTLLRGARRFVVPDSFADDPAALDGIDRLSEDDPRLDVARAAAASDLRVIQILSGGPDLADRYEHDPDPFRKALISAAMDVTRLGHRVQIPWALLRDAAVGYLPDAERADQPQNWFVTAIATCTESPNGIPLLQAASSVDGYLLADYLIEHSRVTRGHLLFPGELWAALAEHVTDLEQRAQLAEQANIRHLYRLAAELAEPAARGGNMAAIDILRARLRRTNRSAEIRPLLQAAAVAGSVNAMMALGRELEVHRDQTEALAWWRRAADTGNPYAMWQLAVILGGHGRCRASGDRAELAAESERWMIRAAQAGDEGAIVDVGLHLPRKDRVPETIALLRPHAEAGVEVAIRMLVEVLPATESERWLRRGMELGDFQAVDLLVRRLRYHGRDDEAEQVLRHAAEIGIWHAIDRVAELLDDDDRADDLEHTLRAAARVSENGVQRLIDHLLWYDRYDDAVRFVRSGAARNCSYAIVQLAKRLFGQAEIEMGMEVLHTGAELGDGFAMLELATSLRRSGREIEAKHWLRRAVGAPTPGASAELITELEKHGRHADIESLLRYSAESKNNADFERLIAQLERTGRADEALQLRTYGLEPGGATAAPW